MRVQWRVHYWFRGEVAHGVFGELFVFRFAGVMKEEISGARDHHVFVALGMRRIGMIGGHFSGEKSRALGIAKVFADELHRGLGVRQPLAIAGRSVQRDLTKAPWKRCRPDTGLSDRWCRGGNRRLAERGLPTSNAWRGRLRRVCTIAGCVVERHQSSYGPAVLAGVDACRCGGMPRYGAAASPSAKYSPACSPSTRSASWLVLKVPSGLDRNASR